jgi:hypothetical protein
MEGAGLQVQRHCHRLHHLRAPGPYCVGHCREQSAEGTTVLSTPIMGDEGKLYNACRRPPSRACSR